MNNNIEKKLQTIIRDINSQNIIINFSDTLDVIEDLNFNSLDMVLLIIKMEECFEIELSANDLQNNSLSSYKSLKQLLECKLNAKL